MKSLFNYFFRGLLVVFPLGATFFVTGISIEWLNTLSSIWIPDWVQSIPGLGLLLSFAIIVAIGLVFSITLTNPLSNSSKNTDQNTHHQYYLSFLEGFNRSFCRRKEKNSTGLYSSTKRRRSIPNWVHYPRTFHSELL